MILKDLRELAQGIHPSVLTDGGLVEAVEDRCSRLPVTVTVDSSPDLRSMRFKDDIEGAAYFFVTEGLANVLKHAAATRVRVELARSNGDLELRVSDDGRGFEPGATSLNGLAGLTDRFAALAGTVSVTADNRGTTLEGRIPIEAAT
jgi:signal transduction histidine kinase